MRLRGSLRTLRPHPVPNLTIYYRSVPWFLLHSIPVLSSFEGYFRWRIKKKQEEPFLLHHFPSQTESYFVPQLIGLWALFACVIHCFPTIPRMNREPTFSCWNFTRVSAEVYFNPLSSRDNRVTRLQEVPFTDVSQQRSAQQIWRHQSHAQKVLTLSSNLWWSFCLVCCGCSFWVLHATALRFYSLLPTQHLSFVS